MTDHETITPAAPTGTRGVAYLRISTDNQDTTSQRTSIQKWLTANGLKVQAWYTDVGSRHEAYKRAEFQLLMKRVRAGEIDWIVVVSKDRFGTKNSYEFGRFASELQDNDVQLWSVTGGCLTSDDYATEILATVDSLRSRDEQLERSKRAVRGMVEVWETGRTMGGYPPYGFDVACYPAGSNGERWRVVYFGHSKRLKVMPDGTEERYDGKGNFPGRDETDRLELVPTREQKRIEVVRMIFRWYATESLTYGAIASRLNDLGIDPLYSQAWYGNRIIGLLKNPAVLVGKTVGNKQGHGSFFSLRKGKLEAAPTKRGRAVNYRPHDEEDFVYPKEWGTGIIDRDTWDAVQAKLKGIHKTRRSPRSQELWLGQFLYCATCNLRKTGWTQRTHKDPHSYVCGTFRRFGKHNKTGCRLHRVKHSEMVPLVEKWLADTEQKLDEVLTLAPSLGYEEIEASLGRSEQEYCRLIVAVWATMKKWGVQNPSGRPWAANTLAEAFRLHAPKQQAKERKELAMLKERYAESTERYLELPERARAVVRAKLDELEKEIAALEERLRPMDEQLEELKGELHAAKERLRVVKEACAGNNQRVKAQALSKVLARIVCHHEHYTTTPKKLQTERQRQRKGGTEKSRLASVVFEPIVGEPAEISANTTQRNCGSAHR
jgi:DNA invertase Pin-like site-specific DNA recombinase